MTTIKDIARIIVARHHLNSGDAEMFLQSLVEVINDGLLRDRQVKIKGFGTFKLQAMKERSSVNISTGERVVIGEHDKVTFTPDSVMRDIINKPFAQFETVIVEENSPLLNDSYVLEEDEEEKGVQEEEPAKEIIKEEIIEEETVEEEAAEEETVEEKVVEEEAAEEETAEEETVEDSLENTDTSEEEQPEETIPEEEQPEEEQPEEEEQVEEEYSYEEQPEAECGKQYPHCRNIFVYYGVLINIIVAVLAFGLGFIAAKQQWFESNAEQPVIKQEVKAKPQQEVKAKPQQKKPVVADTVEIKKDTAKTVKPIAEPIKKDEPLQGYDSDPRVRTGAYAIMGTDQTVTVKEGQTLKGIAKTYLGPDMECYVEAYNNMKEVKAGDKIKIPKLKLKKLLKK